MMENEAAKAEVEKAVEKETEMAKKFGDLKAKSQQAQQEVVRLRSEQLEAQKKLAMVEVLAVNAARMKELEERRRMATEAAELARKNLAEQRQREKDALEATRRALEEARAAMGAAKGGGRGTKRPAEEATQPDAKRPELADGE